MHTEHKQDLATQAVHVLPAWTTWVALGVGLGGLLIAYRQARQARRAYLGQNFLTLMSELQSTTARDKRGDLKDYLRPIPGSTRKLIRWQRGSSPSARLASEVAQLFDQVGILVNARMVDRATILDNWSPTILEMYIVCLPVLNDRRKTNPFLWRSFDALASRARKTQFIAPELKEAYDRLGPMHVEPHRAVDVLLRFATLKAAYGRVSAKKVARQLQSRRELIGSLLDRHPEYFVLESPDADA